MTRTKTGSSDACSSFPLLGLTAVEWMVIMISASELLEANQFLSAGWDFSLDGCAGLKPLQEERSRDGAEKPQPHLKISFLFLFLVSFFNVYITAHEGIARTVTGISLLQRRLMDEIE